MQASSVSTPIGGDTVTIYVAIELSQRNWVIVIHSPDRGRLSRHTLQAGDGKGLLELIAKVRCRAAKALGRSARAVSCYEAGYDASGFIASWCRRGSTIS